MTESTIKSLNFETIKQGDMVNFPKKGAILLCHYTATVFPKQFSSHNLYKKANEWRCFGFKS